jgi:hypothetical protein
MLHMILTFAKNKEASCLQMQETSILKVISIILYLTNLSNCFTIFVAFAISGKMVHVELLTSDKLKIG